MNSDIGHWTNVKRTLEPRPLQWSIVERPKDLKTKPKPNPELRQSALGNKRQIFYPPLQKRAFRSPTP